MGPPPLVDEDSADEEVKKAANGHVKDASSPQDEDEEVGLDKDVQAGPEGTDKKPWWMKVFSVAWRLSAVLALLYLFICSLTFLTDAFRLVAGKSAGNIFTGNSVLGNPIVGLIIGLLFTVLVQSSSTCSSVIVSLVSSNVLTVKAAIPMIMGSNIGTSMTSTLVSLAHASDGEQFERAFAAATVHDCFNLLAVLVLLTLEVTTDYLYHFSNAITDSFSSSSNSTQLSSVNFLKVITEPFTGLIVQVDKHVLECWSLGECQDERLLRVYCDGQAQSENATHAEGSYCKFLFNLPQLEDYQVGLIILFLALIMLSACLILIVKVLQSSLQGEMALLLKRFINSDVPYVPWLTGYLALAVGTVLTFLLQSSSVFTSSLTPLVGVGLISVDRMYPLVLGSNIGTTTTSILAALAEGNLLAMQVALCHLLFNCTGIVLFYPVPFLRLPLTMCYALGRTTAKYRWFALLYLFVLFFAAPGIILGLSVAGNAALYAVLGPLAVLLVAVMAVNVMQRRCPKFLPAKMRTWDFLPYQWMHSLRPMDSVMRRIFTACCCGRFKFDNGDGDGPGPAAGQVNLAMETETTTTVPNRS